MKCTYRVQVWRRDHWMTLFRTFSYNRAQEWLVTFERFECQLHDQLRIAIP